MAANRKERHSLILHIVSGEPVSSQKELLDCLRARGLKVTQATISRDIRELGLVKVADQAHGYRYLPPKGGQAAKEIFPGQAISTVKAAGNLLVVRTRPGFAQSVAAALDALGWKELVGTVGGDDTVIAVVNDPQAAAELKNRLEIFFSLENNANS